MRSGWITLGIFCLALAGCPKGTGTGTGVEDVDPEFVVNVERDGDQMSPVVVAMPSGQFLVSWDSALDNGANKEIIAKTYLLDGTVQEPDFVVNSYQAQMQDAPSATSTYDGFLVAWQSSPESGDGYNVYVRLYPMWP